MQNLLRVFSSKQRNCMKQLVRFLEHEIYWLDLATGDSFEKETVYFLFIKIRIYHET